MNTRTVKGVEYKLKGTPIEVGKILSFQAKDKNGNDFSLKSIEGKKVISVFPALNTRVCDAQTLQITQWSREYRNISFISITNDPVDVIVNWCAAHGIDNINIVSDREYNEFANATNLYIEGWDKLARGFMILDEDNRIIAQSFKVEQSEDPDYDLVKSVL